MAKAKKSRKKALFIANWKMNPVSLLQAQTLYKNTLKVAAGLKKTTVIIAPPSLFLPSLYSKKGKAYLAGQNGKAEEAGPFTGEISLLMLKKTGASFVILGHSERRVIGETDEEVSRKAQAALAIGIIPIICIGEQKRDSSGEYLAVLERQIQKTLAGLSPAQMEKIILAYEPVWAIGSASRGAMEPRDLHETVLYIQKVISVKFGRELSQKMNIIYGGSVDAGNAGKLLEDGMVNGFLVGRASLDTKTISDLLRAIDNPYYEKN